MARIVNCYTFVRGMKKLLRSIFERNLVFIYLFIYLFFHVIKFPKFIFLYRIPCTGALYCSVLSLLHPVLSTRKLTLKIKWTFQKKNQCTCTTAWLLNGFPSQEMFKVHRKLKKKKKLLLLI